MSDEANLLSQVQEVSHKYPIYGMMLGYFPDIEFIRYAKAVIKQVAIEYGINYREVQALVQAKSKYNPFYFRMLGSINARDDVETLIEWGLTGIKAFEARKVGFDSKYVTILLEPELNILYYCKYKATILRCVDEIRGP
ncbi:MAG: hypothetical protein ACREBU_00225 [Nitrososphaera sp.]